MEALVSPVEQGSYRRDSRTNAMVDMGVAGGGLAILLTTFFAGAGGLIAAAAGVALIATVFAAVYHAEVVAHRTGEPFGTLVLAVAVTVIEVALIVSVMISAPVKRQVWHATRCSPQS